MLPESYYGLGQTATQLLHRDFNPETEPGVPITLPLTTPPAVSAPDLSGLALPTINGSTGPGIEVMVSLKPTVRVPGLPRQFDVPVVVRVRNRTATAMQKIQLDVSLTRAFGDLLAGTQPAASIDIFGDTSVLQGTLTLNPAYDGTANPHLLSGTDSLAAYAAGTTSGQAALGFTLRFTFLAQTTVPRSERNLYATASAGTPGTNPGFDYSTSGSPAAPPGSSTWVASYPGYAWAVPPPGFPSRGMF